MMINNNKNNNNNNDNNCNNNNYNINNNNKVILIIIHSNNMTIDDVCGCIPLHCVDRKTCAGFISKQIMLLMCIYMLRKR